MAWTGTTLYPGPPATNNYAFTIGGLAPSTNYQYRAYFIIDGVSYYGNVLSGTTAAITLLPPEVTTGIARCVTTTSFCVCSNEIDEDGGAPIVEYGILYTQTGIYGTIGNLIYGNVGSFVRKTSCCCAWGLGCAYSMAANCCLSPSTTTYYRAFARNAVGPEYGSIKTQATASPPPPPSINIDIWLDWCGSSGFNDGFCGNFQLKCCNGASVGFSDCIYTICDGTHYTCFAPVPAGCYYLDFYGISSACGGVGEPAEIYLDDDTGSGWRKVTGCFSASNLVCGCVYNAGF